MTNSVSAFEEFQNSAASPPVRGFLHRAAPLADGLVLTHGAGGNANSPFLIALAQQFAAAGITVLRCDLPYRQKRSFGPPRDGADDRAGLRNAVTALRDIVGRRLFLGGQSYGGRQATMLVAEEAKLVSGLLILSYPLHAPGKANPPRTAHLPSLRVPALFIEGSEDPFGTLDEIRSALELIPAPTALLEVPGAGHDLYGHKKKLRTDLPGKVVDEFREFFGEG